MRSTMRMLFALLMQAHVPYTLGASAAIVAPGHPRGVTYSDERILVRVIPRSPAQMAAFYEARGFPPRAIAESRRYCFMTVHVDNLSDDIIWLEPRTWRLTAAGRDLVRMDEQYWHTRWQELELGRANLSTFGWTLLPEVRDLHPGEPAGGNIVLPLTPDAVTVTMHFRTGAHGTGKEIEISFPDLQCPREAVK
jgi:hypothetical protein